MKPANDHALDLAFREARSFNRFTAEPVTDETLAALYELLKWGPTSMNCQPARYVFLRTQAAKQRLKPALSPGNVDKTLAAPVVAIVAIDNHFHEHLPLQFPAYDARPMFEANPALATATADRNGSLQGAYLMIAARLLGLDCGPMSGFDAAKLNAEFFPDGRWRANFLVNLGHGDASGNHPRGPRLEFEQAVTLL
ncbi:malonic semialdehyde reductase [Rubrivivax rivuli]|uniref:Putative NADH dehydrogenase/NAD(P)H nitroreductase EOE66_04420 n=1 Tax=Rubrivivax rivuli TaxID=1862385 RepID=A0A437RST3_9BURK|nr:malonic semialdehyde reductase [Rubrivivax rivuli]RVU49801.1 malonic semialdehyde reductase [Rubrivivax rivuli]